MMVSTASVLLLAVATVHPCFAFSTWRPSNNLARVGRIRVTSDATIETTAKPVNSALDPTIAARFTVQVCTSTSCTRKLNQLGLDQYHVLGEIYAQAQAVDLEKCTIIEDGGCQGGKNCKIGPCVSVQHEDFHGNVALEGMNSNEFQERVFHNIVTEDDAARVWTCIENAITLMTDEANAENECDSETNDST